MYADHQTGRLVGSTKLNNFLDNSNHDLQIRDKVHLIIWDTSELGSKVIINKKHLGLIYSNEVFKNLTTGDQTSGFIKKFVKTEKLMFRWKKLVIKISNPMPKK